jgi:hypothetical protein
MQDVFIPFVGIDSETDHLPVGAVRAEWDAEALATKDVEIRQCEDHYRPYALEACRRLIDRLRSTPR